MNMKTNKQNVGAITWKNALSIALSVLSVICTTPVQATLPIPSTQMTVTSGALNGAPYTNGQTLNINTSSQNTVLTWSNFSDAVSGLMAAGDVVNFNQPNSSSAVLNYINSNVVTNLSAGAINSNGKLFFMNPAGFTLGGGTITAPSVYFTTVYESSAYFSAFGTLSQYTAAPSSLVSSGIIYVNGAENITTTGGSGTINLTAGYTSGSTSIVVDSGTFAGNLYLNTVNQPASGSPTSVRLANNGGTVSISSTGTPGLNAVGGNLTINSNGGNVHLAESSTGTLKLDGSLSVNSSGGNISNAGIGYLTSILASGTASSAYTVTDSLTVAAPGATAANGVVTATATISALNSAATPGIASISIINPGQGYTAVPSVTDTSSTAAGQTFTAVVADLVASAGGTIIQTGNSVTAPANTLNAGATGLINLLPKQVTLPGTLSITANSAAISYTGNLSVNNSAIGSGTSKGVPLTSATSLYLTSTTSAPGTSLSGGNLTINNTTVGNGTVTLSSSGAGSNTIAISNTTIGGGVVTIASNPANTVTPGVTTNAQGNVTLTNDTIGNGSNSTVSITSSGYSGLVVLNNTTINRTTDLSDLQPAATATVSLGNLTGAIVVAGGSGYTNSDTVNIYNGNTTLVAQGTLTVNATTSAVTGVSFTPTQAAALNAVTWSTTNSPTAVINSTAGAGASIVPIASISAINLASGGSGYTSAPIITISAPATYTVSGSGISTGSGNTLALVSVGSYTLDTATTVINGGGNVYSANNVTAINAVNATATIGNGYSAVPTVTIAPPTPKSNGVVIAATNPNASGVQVNTSTISSNYIQILDSSVSTGTPGTNLQSYAGTGSLGSVTLNASSFISATNSSAANSGLIINAQNALNATGTSYIGAPLDISVGVANVTTSGSVTITANSNLYINKIVNSNSSTTTTSATNSASFTTNGNITLPQTSTLSGIVGSGGTTMSYGTITLSSTAGTLSVGNTLFVNKPNVSTTGVTGIITLNGYNGVAISAPVYGDNATNGATVTITSGNGNVVIDGGLVTVNSTTGTLTNLPIGTTISAYTAPSAPTAVSVGLSTATTIYSATIASVSTVYGSTPSSALAGFTIYDAASGATGTASAVGNFNANGVLTSITPTGVFGGTFAASDPITISVPAINGGSGATTLSGTVSTVGKTLTTASYTGGSGYSSAPTITVALANTIGTVSSATTTITASGTLSAIASFAGSNIIYPTATYSGTTIAATLTAPTGLGLAVTNGTLTIGTPVSMALSTLSNPSKVTITAPTGSVIIDNGGNDNVIVSATNVTINSLVSTTINGNPGTQTASLSGTTIRPSYPTATTATIAGSLITLNSANSVVNTANSTNSYALVALGGNTNVTNAGTGVLTLNNGTNTTGSVTISSGYAVNIGTNTTDSIAVGGNLNIIAAGLNAASSAVNTVALGAQVQGSVNVTSTIGSVTIGSFPVINSIGNVATNNSSFGAINVTASNSGAVNVYESSTTNLGNINAGTLNVESYNGNIITTGNVNTSGIVNLYSALGSVSLGSITNPASLLATGTVSVLGSPSTISVISTGSQSIVTPNSTTISLISLNNVGSSGNITLTTGNAGKTTNLNVVNSSSNGTITITSNNNSITTASLASYAGNITVTASGTSSLTNLQVNSQGGTVTITANAGTTTISNSSITIGGGLSLTSPNINIGANVVTNVSNSTTFNTGCQGKGTITETSGNPVTIVGPASFTANSIVLNVNPTNDAITGTLSLTTNGSYQVVEPGVITLGTVKFGAANSNITAGTGSITSGTITAQYPVATLGSTPVISFVAPVNVTLNSASNSFTSNAIVSVQANTGNAIVNASGNLTLGIVTVNAGTFNSAVTGNIAQSAGSSMWIYGNPTLTSTAGSINLSNAGNNFGSITASGLNVNIREQGTNAYNSVVATGNFTAQSDNGNVQYTNNTSVTPSILVTGNTSITANNGYISLASVANNFGGGVISLTTNGNATIADSALLTTIGSSNVGGNLSVTNNTGYITDTSNSYNVAGVLSLNATGANGYISLTGNSATFGGLFINTTGLTTDVIYSPANINLLTGSSAVSNVQLYAYKNITTAGSGGTSFNQSLYLSSTTGSINISNVSVATGLIINAPFGPVNLTGESLSGMLRNIPVTYQVTPAAGVTGPNP
jgi:Repeats of unknown function (DUF5649)